MQWHRSARPQGFSISRPGTSAADRPSFGSCACYPPCGNRSIVGPQPSPRWPHWAVGGALRCPRVPSASPKCGSESARQVRPCSRVQCSLVVPGARSLGAHRMTVIIDKRRSWYVPRGSALGACRGARAMTSLRDVTWLILPVVICLSQRLSHACVSMN